MSSRLPAHTYKCVLCTHIRIYVCRDLLHLDSSGPPGVSSPTPGLTSKYPICTVCVCVCVYTHTRTHTHTPALKIEKTQTTPLSFLLSKMNMDVYMCVCVFICVYTYMCMYMYVYIYMYMSLYRMYVQFVSFNIGDWGWGGRLVYVSACCLAWGGNTYIYIYIHAYTCTYTYTYAYTNVYT